MNEMSDKPKYEAEFLPRNPNYDGYSEYFNDLDSAHAWGQGKRDSNPGARITIREDWADEPPGNYLRVVKIVG